ncbi:hypothetical protein HID58_005171 [Brassica napus]|uniref:Uncharacterized protein n=1 Tax=Brassica napus TaxID=3708 RepID=A0ABQ8E7V7_BRANA|nr:hypothetical protein HID58_005171 [Brassica napus]
MHQILMSRKMTLEPCTLTLYIGTHALSLCILYCIRKNGGNSYELKENALRFSICVDEGLVKKLANVHSDNLMFSKLDDLGCGIRRTDLAWCLMLLCHAHLVSRKGLDYVVKEMEEREFHRLLEDR